MKPTISCIIAAHNEAPRIGNVLKVVCESPYFSEIIVVDDGSKDETLKIAKAFSVIALRHPKNLGRAAAIHTGFLQSSGQIIVTIDSDLVGLTQKNLAALINPVILQPCLSLSIIANTWLNFHLEGVDPWSGSRAFPREILELAFQNQTIVDQRYAIESYINQQALIKKWPIFSIEWPNVQNIPKNEKGENRWRGFWLGIKMFYDVYTSFGILKTLYQQSYLPIKVWRDKKFDKSKVNT